jgi:hypothetical protein
MRSSQDASGEPPKAIAQVAAATAPNPKNPRLKNQLRQPALSESSARKNNGCCWHSRRYI